jgi:hypothetical protein
MPGDGAPAGPTPRITRDDWEFVVATETGARRGWSWRDLVALPGLRSTALD